MSTACQQQTEADQQLSVAGNAILFAARARNQPLVPRLFPKSRQICAMFQQFWRLLLLAVCNCGASVLPGGFLTPGEQIAADAIRVTALGTGTPDVRKSAVATAYLIQLGNTEDFIFDLGTGSYLNLLSTGVPQNSLTKVSTVCLPV